MRSRSTEGLLYTHIKSAAQETIHSHTPMLKTSLWGGRPIEQQEDCLSLRLGELLLTAEGVEKSDKMFLSPAHYQGIHHSRHHHTHVSAQQEGVTTVQNDLHGLPVKRKRELCEKLCSTTVFFSLEI